ncbi:hypothetical protein EPN83_02300 [Patescibacteria group bacterium]|nr:MAG: hypothetical protein EPN83_02300 [Patescibacteria group bacterium]
MLKNSIYNLLLQPTEENKSLWRIKNMYLKDSEGNEGVLTFWKKMETGKENHTKELIELVNGILKAS